MSFRIFFAFLMQGQRAREESVQTRVVSCEETQDMLLCVCARKVELVLPV